jgi:hypothetical protein
VGDLDPKQLERVLRRDDWRTHLPNELEKELRLRREIRKSAGRMSHLRHKSTAALSLRPFNLTGSTAGVQLLQFEQPIPS